jgi:hypothetical protein
LPSTWARDARLRHQNVQVWLDRHPQAAPGAFDLELRCPPSITDTSSPAPTTTTIWSNT